MRQEYITNSRAQTKKLGKALAQKLLETGLRKKAQVLALEGDLGGGKTTFLQGFAKGLGVKEKILSPTFVIMKRFTIPRRKASFSRGRDHLRFTNFYHIDCYRIEKAEEFFSLGFKEIIQNPKNIIAIEWAERLRKIMPKRAIWIKFKFVDKKKRKIIIMVK